MIILKFFIFLCVLAKIELKTSSEPSNFIIDYFIFKNVSYVVGFSCNNAEEKFTWIKRFNRQGIRTLFPHLYTDSQIFQLIDSRYWKIGVFVDVSCLDQGVLASLSKATDWRLYGEMHSWLIFADKNVSKTSAQLNESSFGMSTDLVVAVPNADGYDLFDVYNPWKEGGAEINITRFGTWFQSGSINVTLIQSKFTRRCNLHRLIMKASFFGSSYRPKTMSIDEYFQYHSTLEGSEDGYAKFGYIMLLHLSEMYNFTLYFGEVEKWLPEDLLGPMSRALVENEIQFTGSAVVITHERIRLTKFVYAAWPFRTWFIFRTPEQKDIKIGEVLNPFADETWYVTLTMLSTIFITLAVCLREETYVALGNAWSDSFLTTIGCMCQMGTEFNLERISTRIILFHLMIFSYLSYNYYNAAILSVRLNEPIFKINDSLNELGKLNLKMSSEPMMYFDLIFNIVPAWDRKVFFEDKWLKIPESERFMYPERGIHLVQKGGFAYHTHPDVSYPIIDRSLTFREICELVEVNPLVPAYAGLCVSYNSTFFELAKIGLLRMTEVGIRYRQIRRCTSRKPICRTDEMSVNSINIYEFSPHLILLAVGMVTAGAICMFESLFIIYWRNQRRREDIYYGLRESNLSTTKSFLLMLCKADIQNIIEY